MNVYVVHVKAFQHRKATCENLRKTLEEAGKLGSFTYIDDMDPGEPLPNVPINIQPFPSGPNEKYNGLLRPLKVAQVTNTLKHIKALELVANGAADAALVIEDDVAYRNEVAEDVAAALRNFKGGLTFLGTPAAASSLQSGVQPFSEMYQVAPCCDSYLVDRDTARRLLEHMIPIRFPANIQLSYAMENAGVSANIAIPNVFVDGSKLGMYLGSIESNSNMVFNEAFVRCAQTWQAPDFDPSSFDKVDPKWHPELLHLKAQYETKKGNYAQAQDLYKHAVSLYEAHGGVLDNSSELLRNFMRLYRHLQQPA